MTDVTELGVFVSNTDAATNTISVNHTLLAGNGDRIVVISIILFDGTTDPAVTALTYGGVAATLGKAELFSADNMYSAIWYVLEADLPADGVTATVLTCSPVSTNKLGIGVTCIQDAAQAVPEDTDGAQANSTAAAIELISSDGSYQQDALYSAGITSWGANQVQQLNSLGRGISNKEQPTGETDAWTATVTSGNWVYAGASFAAAEPFIPRTGGIF